MSIVLKKYNTTVDLPYGHLAKVIEWCQNNISNDWTYSVTNSVGRTPGIPNYAAGQYEFHFDDEKDYVAFLLAIK